MAEVGGAPNAASVALVRDGRVLLIQRAFAPLEGLWTLPGGRLEPGETIEDCARREVREEVGLIVGVVAPVTIMGVAGRFRLAVFASADFSGEIVASDEISGWQWLAPPLPPGLPVTPGLADVLAAAFAPRRLMLLRRPGMA